MILCVDVGNTSTKLFAVEGEKVVGRTSARTDAIEAACDEGVLASAGKSVTGGRRIAGIAISSVVPSLVPSVRRALQAEWEAPFHLVSHESRLPMRLLVSRPEAVGPDRLCAAAGAIDAEHTDAVVVDVGSAVTIDRVRDLEFIGGAIMPGPGMMLSSLGRDASLLPEMDLDAVETLFPDPPEPTERAMALGVGVATLGGIVEGVRRMAGSEPDVPVWLTGGHAGLVQSHLPDSWIHDPDLSARGMYRIARLNLDLLGED